MNKRIHDLIRSSTDLKKLMEALADSIDHGQLTSGLQALGIPVDIDTVDWNTFGTLTISGALVDQPHGMEQR